LCGVVDLEISISIPWSLCS